jgi:hypothetical protein
MATTYEPISTQTLGSAQASVTLSSIPATYTDLYLVTNAKHTADSNAIIQFNGDTTTNYSYTYLYGNGTSATSSRTASTASPIVDYYSLNGTGSTNVSIMNYANTTTYKTAISRGSESVNGVMAVVVLWRKTPEAITSILLKPSSGNFDIGSTFTLYGIKAA